MHTCISAVEGKNQGECLWRLKTCRYLHIQRVIISFCNLFVSRIQKQRNSVSEAKEKESVEELEVGPAVSANNNLYMSVLMHVLIIENLYSNQSHSGYFCPCPVFSPQCSNRADLLATIKSKSYGNPAMVCLIYLNIYQKLCVAPLT